MEKYYKLKLLGTERDLPVLPSPSGIMIAGFNSVGDTKLLLLAGKKIKELLDGEGLEFDVILTTELKGIPISQEVARLYGKDYVALRKQEKCYMLEPQKITSESITSGKTEFYISKDDLNKLQNQKVLFVDDVYSTGATFKGMIDCSQKLNFNIVAGAFILREVPKDQTTSPLVFESYDKKVFCCGHLPLQ